MLSILAMMTVIQSGQPVSGNLANQVIDVINVNTFVPLSIIRINQRDEIKDVTNYINSKVRSETTGLEEMKNLVVASKEDELDPLLPFLVNEKLQMSILFLVGQIDDLELFKDDLTAKLRNIENEFYFYLVLESDGRLFWHNVLSIRKTHSPSIGHVTISDDFFMKEQYDLKGMTIKSIDTPYPPFFTMDCDDDGKNCKTGGFSSDVVVALATKLNFTWERHKEPNDNLGLIAVSGPNNVSGTFEGVFGAVVKGDEYQMAVANYALVLYRADMFEFVHSFTFRDLLAMMVRKSDTDYGLFIRPFRNLLWLAIGVFTTLILVILFIMTLKAKEGEIVDGRRAIETVSWFVFLLVNSYHSGALTMYFSSNPALPFETINDVLRAHPDWILKHIKDTHIQFVSNPDPDFVTYWNRIKNELEKYTFDTTEDGIKELENGRTVAQFSSRDFQRYISNHPHMISKIRSFSHMKPDIGHIITPKGSPLAIALRQATFKLEESGLHSHLYRKHFGDNINRRSYTFAKDSLITLSAGQVILIFLIMVTMVLLALCILALELFWKNFWMRKVRVQILI